MFANAIFTPEPNFEYATRGELVVWGGCMALAAVLAGWWLVAVLRTACRPKWWLEEVRRPKWWLLAGSLICLTAGCVAATKGHGRLANERIEQFRAREKATQDSATPERQP